MKINIITIKWGTKYDHRYPNKLFEDCKDKCTFDFDFYCVTDNKENIHDDIICLEMPTHSNLNYYDFIDDHRKDKVNLWDRPKLYLFSDFNNYFQGINIFLDLDTVVTQDLKYLTTLSQDKPWIIDMWWKTDWRENWDKLWGTRINSSVIVWTDNQCKKITEKIVNGSSDIFVKYATIDCFIGYELTDYTNHQECFFNFLPSFVAIDDYYTWYYNKSQYPDGYLINLHSTSQLGKHSDTPGF